MKTGYKNLLFILSAVVLVMPLSVMATDSFPPFPMAFQGEAKLNGNKLLAGTRIMVYCGNDLMKEVEMEENGIYGYDVQDRLFVGDCSGDILFKYLLAGTTNPLTGAEEIKYTDGFEEGKTVNKNLEFINSQSCTISNGTGNQTWNGSIWGDCTVVNCNSGYTQSDNSCIQSPSTSSSGGGSGGGGDYTAPTISNINIAIRANGATITWITNESSISWVAYGTSTSYGLEAKTTTYDTSHSLILSNLSPSTVYHYSVKSKDSAGNIDSYVDKSFTTTKEGSVSGLGDMNNDGKINKYDFSLMMANWGKTGTNISDLNNDGKVDKYDFALLMLNWSI